MPLTIQQAASHMGPMFEHIAGDGALVLEHLNLKPGALVLDVGTGVGNFAVFLALKGFEVVTGEPVDDTTRYAGHDWAANATACGVENRIRFQSFAAHHMPFTSNLFDSVFFFGVLHHIDAEHRSAAFQEALRVAKPGATVTYFEPSLATLKRIREQDPEHPPAALPSEYQGESAAMESRLAGAMMDIYVYQK